MAGPSNQLGSFSSSKRRPRDHDDRCRRLAAAFIGCLRVRPDATAGPLVANELPMIEAERSVRVVAGDIRHEHHSEVSSRGLAVS